MATTPVTAPSSPARLSHDHMNSPLIHDTDILAEQQDHLPLDLITSTPPPILHSHYVSTDTATRRRHSHEFHHLGQGFDRNSSPPLLPPPLSPCKQHLSTSAHLSSSTNEDQVGTVRSYFQYHGTEPYQLQFDSDLILNDPSPPVHQGTVHCSSINYPSSLIQDHAYMNALNHELSIPTSPNVTNSERVSDHSSNSVRKSFVGNDPSRLAMSQQSNQQTSVCTATAIEQGIRLNLASHPFSNLIPPTHNPINLQLKAIHPMSTPPASSTQTYSVLHNSTTPSKSPTGHVSAHHSQMTKFHQLPTGSNARSQNHHQSPPLRISPPNVSTESKPTASTNSTSFHVVGVLPAPRSTSNRLTIFLAPKQHVSTTSMSTASSSDSLKSIVIPQAQTSQFAIDSTPSFSNAGGSSTTRSASALHIPITIHHRGSTPNAFPFCSTRTNCRTTIPRHNASTSSPSPGIISSFDANEIDHARLALVNKGATACDAKCGAIDRQYACNTRLKEIDLAEFNSRSIFVRFSTSDSNPNEKVVPAEWKGRARSNELYTTNRLGPRIELTRSSGNNGDKSGFVFINTLCKAAKMQSVYLASELREVGLFQGALIPALWLKLSDVPDRALENLRVAFTWSQDDNLTEFVDPVEIKVVFGPKTMLHGDFNLGWLRLQLDVPIEWDGKRNLLLELSKDETHASFSWPATGGLFFKSTSAIRTVSHKDNNDSSGQYPFLNWTKPARFRRVPVLAVESICPPSYKIICQVPEATFHNSLVKVEVSLDGVHFCKSVATYVHRDPDPAALGRVLSDLARLLPQPDIQSIPSVESQAYDLTSSGLSVDTHHHESRSGMSTCFHDVIFLVGHTPTPFRAHQAILASRSPIFQRMFASPMIHHDHNDEVVDEVNNTDHAQIVTPVHREIIVSEISPPIFALILQFIYTASLSIPLESACEVLKAAELYALSDLKRSCEEFLKQNTSIENVTGLLLAAEQFKVHSVRSFALDFVLWHFDSVSRDPAFARDILPRADLVREILLARRRGLLAYGSGVGGTPPSQAGDSLLIDHGGTARAGGQLRQLHDPTHYPPNVTTIPNPHISTTMLPVSVNSVVGTGHALSMAISFPQGLFADLKQLLHSGPLGFPDVKLVVHGCKAESVDSAVDACDVATTRDQTTVFYAHKVILCTRCEVLEAMLLRSDMREANSIPHTVVVPNIRPAVFKSLLAFLYMGRCELNYDNVFELYRAADQYCLSDLKDACEEFLIQEISLDNVGAVLLDSDVNLVNPIRSYSIDLAVREFDDVSVTQRFLEDVVPRQDLLLEIFQTRGVN